MTRKWTHVYDPPLRSEFPDPAIGALEYWLIQVVYAATLEAWARLDQEAHEGNWTARHVATHLAINYRRAIGGT